VKSKTFLIQSEGLGHGDDRLGSLLMGNFLRVLAESKEKPGKILFWNKGVLLVCEGSGVLVPLKSLESQGVELLACTTCLQYLGVEDKLRVGQPTTMVKAIESLQGEDVVSL
jgi:selenium metabolism protein YedF